MQPFAVSVLSEQPEGVLRHSLYIVEAGGVDAAEARVLSRLTRAGHLIKGLLSQSAQGVRPTLLTPS